MNEPPQSPDAIRTPLAWFEAAVEITPGFEVSGNPYLGVAGDFDGMGLSCGALQWNIGSRTLQPMVLAAGEETVRASMPVYGGDFWRACQGSIAEGLRQVRRWQAGRTLRPRVKAELVALMGMPAMIGEQKRRIGLVADRALDSANRWSQLRQGAPASKRLFCWFFDVLTQNGGLEGLSPAMLAAFIADHKPDRVDDFVCNFLATQKGTSGHVRDAHANALLWRDAATGEQLDLLCMSYLRARTALPQWRHVVLNRKGTIAMGGGWVNRSRRSFAHLGL